MNNESPSLSAGTYEITGDENSTSVKRCEEGALMSDITHFDFICYKHEIITKYLRYLPPFHLKIILLLTQPRENYRTISEYLMQEEDNIRKFTPSRIKSYVREARIKIYQLQHYAKLFNCENAIPPCSYEELKNKLNDFYEREIIT